MIVVRKLEGEPRQMCGVRIFRLVRARRLVARIVGQAAKICWKGHVSCLDPFADGPLAMRAHSDFPKWISGLEDYATNSISKLIDLPEMQESWRSILRNYLYNY